MPNANGARARVVYVQVKVEVGGWLLVKPDQWDHDDEMDDRAQNLADDPDDVFEQLGGIRNDASYVEAEIDEVLAEGDPGFMDIYSELLAERERTPESDPETEEEE